MRNQKINYKYNIGDRLVDENRDITILDRKFDRTQYIAKTDGRHKKGEKFYVNVIKYKIGCNKCRFDGNTFYRKGKEYDEYWVQQGNIANRKDGCTICRNVPQINVPHINSIVANNETKWMISYFQGGYDEAKKYTPCSNEKKYFVCPECGRIRDKKIMIHTLYKHKRLSCMCSDGISYPNKYGFELFNNQLKNQIKNLIREYQPEWAKPYYYDFYFEKYGQKYICEFDGGLGHGKEIHKRSNKSLEDTIKIDKIKEDLALSHRIFLIRIDTSISDSDFISLNIKKSKLSEVCELSDVDFSASDEFACSNLVKTICLDYENSELHIDELAEKYHLSYQTIFSYIKHGKNIGWCSRKYTPPRKTTKKVKMTFSDGDYEIFESAAELSRVSYEKFGVKLYKEGINAVCNGRSKSCNGYSNFEYVTDEEVAV